MIGSRTFEGEFAFGFDDPIDTVTPNFSPGNMLAYLMSSVVNVLQESGVPWREQAVVQGTTLGEWAHFWKGETGPPNGFETLQNLPQAAQKKIAAGFELIGRKPNRK
jgi:hypothetical protein